MVLALMITCIFRFIRCDFIPLKMLLHILKGAKPDALYIRT
jgi:hypothetical protein